MELSQLKAALPRKRARKAWLKLLAAAQRAAWQQRLCKLQQQEAALAIQAAYRGWVVRRVTAKQLAGVRRFQVRVWHTCWHPKLCPPPSTFVGCCVGPESSLQLTHRACGCMGPVAEPASKHTANGLPLHLQALWRGHKVRKQCGRAGRDARRRLEAVAAAAEAAPQRRIGVRTREALDVLLASRQCSQVSSSHSGLRRGVFCRAAVSILCLLSGRWCMKADYGRVLPCLSSV